MNEAAKRTGIPASTIRRWVAEGRLTRSDDTRCWVNPEEATRLRQILDTRRTDTP